MWNRQINQNGNMAKFLISPAQWKVNIYKYVFSFYNELFVDCVEILDFNIAKMRKRILLFSSKYLSGFVQNAVFRRSAATFPMMCICYFFDVFHLPECGNGFY